MSDDLVKKIKIGSKPSFASRAEVVKADGGHRSLDDVMNEAKGLDSGSNVRAANRIGLMLDCSGSMREHDHSPMPKIEMLKTGMQGFLNAMDWSNSKVAMYTFPSDERDLSLTNAAPILQLRLNDLEGDGGTPLGRSMAKILERESMTRAVIVSDGEADSRCEEEAREFREAGIPIDCVHIGTSTKGERTLQQIAEITGGKYIKFTDLSSFSGAMKYLAPKFRALLNSTRAAGILGATEVK
jgi:Mg-chelatase subunit ChlD